jgi:hypothetical protein
MVDVIHPARKATKTPTIMGHAAADVTRSQMTSSPGLRYTMILVSFSVHPPGWAEVDYAEPARRQWAFGSIGHWLLTMVHAAAGASSNLKVVSRVMFWSWIMSSVLVMGLTISGVGASVYA